jgi:ATP-dependent Clp protease ATP-binding subunit ClpA
MFERFTKEARSVVLGAQEVARDTATRSVDSRHLLVALLEKSGPAQRALRQLHADPAALVAGARAELGAGGIDADALAGIGIDLDAVRREADAVFGPGSLDGAGRTPRGHIPFASDAKKSLELALREAIRLKQREIHSAHLLLGILRAESPGRAVLVRAGVDTDSLRTALEDQTKAA